MMMTLALIALIGITVVILGAAIVTVFLAYLFGEEEE